MDYPTEMERTRALENALRELECELEVCKREKFDLRNELERLAEHRSRLVSLIDQYREVLRLARCSNERNKLEEKKFNCIAGQNEKMKREIIVLRYDLKNLCARNRENEEKICEQENEIEDLKRCCRCLLREKHEIQKQMEEQTVNVECYDMENRPGEQALDYPKANERKMEDEGDEVKSLVDEKNAGQVDESVQISLASATLESMKLSMPPQPQAIIQPATTLIEDLRKQEKESPSSVTPSEANKLAVGKIGALPPETQTQAAAGKGGVLPAQNEAQAGAAKGGVVPILNEIQTAAGKGGVLPAQNAQNEAQAGAAKGGVVPILNETQAATGKAEVLPAQNEAQAGAAKGGVLPTQNETQAASGKGGVLPSQNEAKAAAEKVSPPQTQSQAAAGKDGVIPTQNETQAAAAAKGGVPPTQAETKAAAEKVSPPQTQSQAAAGKDGVKPAQNETQAAAAAKGGVLPTQAETKAAAGKVSPPQTQSQTGAAKGGVTPTRNETQAAAGKGGVLPAQNETKAAAGKVSQPQTQSQAAGGKGGVTPTQNETRTPVGKGEILTAQKGTEDSAAKAEVTQPENENHVTPSKHEVSFLEPGREGGLQKDGVQQSLQERQRTPGAGKNTGPEEGSSAAKKLAPASDPFRSSDSDESILDITEADPDFSNFLCKLNPADHKRNLCEIEKRYRQKLCEIQCKNEEKVRKLIQQHEKEDRVRQKMYNDNVNNMRTGYNTDIHKLVEKHKASILRLQSLHEDEVQELNTNYETQLEAMQTQNENIVNDLTMGATAKFKLLADQHNKDMKELERKYQELLEKKEKEHATDLVNFNSGSLQTGDGKSRRRSERDVNIPGEGNVTDMKTKHERELKNLKRSNLKRIDMIRHKYEDLLTCERKKYEKQLEDMVERLKKGKGITQGICQCRMPGPCAPKDPNAPLEFNDVLQKILAEGLENLTFNEVALVHRKTCAATEDIVLNPEVRPQLEPSIGEAMYCGSQLKGNKKDVLNRILLMENDIAAKEKETHDWIVNMELAVKEEKRKLEIAATRAGVLPASKKFGTTPEKDGTLPSRVTDSIAVRISTSSPEKVAESAPVVENTPDGIGKPFVRKRASAPDTFRSSDSDESFLDLKEVDSDFSDFLYKLNPADHKRNLCEIEKRYQQKLCEIQLKNEEKVRKLIQQHEKEERVKEKLYDDNVSTMRTGYNTDIHKLVEKHKASILRLQSLHEEEVQDLKGKYKSQLEAAQTENENMVNDLTTGATAKFKLLADQHNKDMKELERKYQELLEKKEKEHATDLVNFNSGSLQTGDGKNRSERDFNTPGGEGNVTDMKKKHERELKNLKRSNLKRIDMIRHKYEDLLTCERKKYEKQLEDMMAQLEKGKGITQGICQCRMPGPCAPKDPNAPLEFNDVLQKILAEGLENLTFNEVALVHRKTCAATEDIVLNPEVRPQLEPSIGEGTYCGSELKGDKKDLLNRILLMENDIAAKQKETHDWINEMENAVNRERLRLEKLRALLRNDYDANCEVNPENGMSGSNTRSTGDVHSSFTEKEGINRELKELPKSKSQV